MTKSQPAEPLITTIPLHRLTPGDAGEASPHGGINARTTGREDALDELKSSIASMGLLQSLAIVLAEDGTACVADGNRRLRAMKALAEDGILQPDFAVPVIVLDSNADAFEASLAANVVRLPLHPADQAEAFAILADAGLAPDEIASRFGLAKRIVERRLALGRLAPDVRRAWREGWLDETGVKFFTMAPDLEKQRAAIATLLADVIGDEKPLDDWDIRYELGLVDQRSDDAGKLMAVGIDAYIAAGGHLIEDLFDDKHVVLDPKILQNLGDELVNKTMEAIRAEGWREVIKPPRDRWNWKKWSEKYTKTQKDEMLRLAEERAKHPRSSAEWKEADAAIKAIEEAVEAIQPDEKSRKKLAVFVSLTSDGLVIERGMIPPNVNAKQIAAEERDEPDETIDPPIAKEKAPANPFAISQFMCEFLEEDMSRALKVTLLESPGIALRAFVAHGQMGMGISAFSFFPAGQEGKIGFEEALNALLDETDKSVIGDIAALVAKEVHVFGLGLDKSAFRSNRDSVHALARALGKKFDDAIKQSFRAERYFESGSVALAKAAMAEMGGVAPSGSKAEVAAAAVALARQTGWLPPELRLPSGQE
jgi:ParB family chromosome partitioning protein